MKRLNTRLMELGFGALLGLGLAACGSSSTTHGNGAAGSNSGSSSGSTTGGGSSDDGGTSTGGKAGNGGIDAHGKTRKSDDFTVKRIEDVKAPVYLAELSREAQDAFRQGVEAVAPSPSATDRERSAFKPDFALALAKFKDAAQQEPAFLEAFFNWGMVLERTGRSDDALAVYQDALNKNPGDTSANAYVAKLYLAKARNAKFLGKPADEKKFLGQSKTLLDQLVAQDPDNVAVNNAVALYYLSLDDLDTSERYVKEVLYVQPENVTGLNTRGLINLKRGKLLIAKWIFENKVLRIDPTSSEALTNLGFTYIKLDQRPLAMRQFKKALEANPENMAVRMNIAAMLLEHLDYATAAEHYDKVLHAQPNNPEAAIGQCDAKYGLGGSAAEPVAQFTDAIGCYDAFVSAHPERADLYKRMAQAYQNKLQDLDNAVKYYELYGQNATLSPKDAKVNTATVATLKEIIAAGGLKAMLGGDDLDDGDEMEEDGTDVDGDSTDVDGDSTDVDGDSTDVDGDSTDADVEGNTGSDS